jgi:hypothetical protein
MPRLVTASLIVLMAAAGPALAQPTGTPARPPAGTATPAPAPAPPPANPPVGTNPPPTASNPPLITAPPVETPPVEAPPVNQPVQQAAPPPPAPIELSTNVEYPNGLADPQENFARADNDRDGGGFPWGLLGLLGLLGLVPWLRGGPKTIYVEREKPGQDPTRPRE